MKKTTLIFGDAAARERGAPSAPVRNCLRFMNPYDLSERSPDAVLGVGFSLGGFRSRAKAYSNNSNEAQSSFFGGEVFETSRTVLKVSGLRSHRRLSAGCSFLLCGSLLR